MDNEKLVRRWQNKIIQECEKRLRRQLSMREKRFITSRGSFIALETIEDTVRTLHGHELEDYLNSE